ncbi:hypothetical protein HPB47_008972, partial [Ixodes persulcatus]
CKDNSRFADNLKNCIRTRFVEFGIDEVASQAMLLDPRFKATVQQASGNMILLQDLVIREIQTADVELSGDTAMPAYSSCPQVASSVWNAFDHQVMNKEKTTLASAPQKEVTVYADKPLVDMGKDLCEWWQCIGRFKNPHLRKLT